MATSSILGADYAPAQPSGRGSDLLGPSDNSDSGSDALGTGELHGDSDAAGTGERGAVAGADALEGADIAPDRIVGADEALGGTYDDPIAATPDASGSGDGFPAADPDAREYTDLDDDDAQDNAEDGR